MLIEGNKQIGRALPVRSFAFYTTPSQPIIEQVISDTGAKQQIVNDSNLTIRGKHLQAEKMQVKLGDAILTPQSISDREIGLNLSLLSTEEANSLRAGINSLQIIHLATKLTPLEPDRGIGSNIMPLVLCPRIVGEVEILDMWSHDDELYSAEVKVQVDLIVGKSQRVLIFLNQLPSEKPADYIFMAKSRRGNTDKMKFPILNVAPGEYLVRVQVDDAESPLRVDTDAQSDMCDRYVSPTMVFG